MWQKERERLLAEQKELEGEMAAFVSKHEEEINELLREYWMMRKQAGERYVVMRLWGTWADAVCRGLHEHNDSEARPAAQSIKQRPWSGWVTQS